MTCLVGIMERLKSTVEAYRSGHNGPHSKCGYRAIGTRVRIPSLPPNERHGNSRAFLRFLRNSDAVPTVKNICTALVEFEEYLDDIQNRYCPAENAKDNDTQKILLHTTLGHRHFLHFCIFPDKTPQTMHLTTKTAPFLKCLKQSS